MASPMLIIRRVVVQGDLHLDLWFNDGLNVVEAVPSGGDTRSTNRCGKTALVELIQYGLGRRHESRAKFHFEPIMNQLKTLWLEIEVNGQVMTIERSLQAITSPVRVRDGAFHQDMAKLPAELVVVADLSSVLLRQLGIPEESVKTVEGDLVPLTLPTLMRAFILHQEDSFGAILDKMIPEQRRTDVIGFLSGITPVGRFAIEEELAETQTEVQKLDSYHESVKAFLEQNGVASVLQADARLRQAQSSLQSAKEDQYAIQVSIREASRAHSVSRAGRIDMLNTKLMSIKAEIAASMHALVGLRQEGERLRDLVSSLQADRQKSKRLQASTSILSSVEFGICPRCLQEVTTEMKQREEYARCYLCNRSISTNSDSVPSRMPKTQDLDMQIEEAQDVLRGVQEDIATEEVKLSRLENDHAAIAAELDVEMAGYVSPALDHLLQNSGQIASMEAELGEAKRLHEQAIALRTVRERLQILQNEQDELSVRLREARQPNKGRLSEFRDIYESILRAVDFPGFVSCSINSNTLMPYINGSLYTRQGVALKGLAVTCYHLALLQLACKEETFFPRLLVIDSPAVGDLNEENHKRLLRYLAQLQTSASDSGAIDWQIILTTRRAIPELDPYVRMTISSDEDRMLLRRSP